KADLFVASDGPRLSAERPTIFLGCRGGLRIHLDVILRDGGHHSGNWGGVLANAATVLSNAIACLVNVKGQMQLEALKPPRISNAIRNVLADVKVEPTADEPQLSPNWGEEGLSPAERLYAWNTLEVLAMSSGNIVSPANAIPGEAHAVLQLRFVVGTKYDQAVDAVRKHLHAHGFPMVEVSGAQSFAASRTDFDSPWINWAAESIRQTTGKAPAILPNFGGSLPNDVFSEGLGLPTIWVPHSYPGCSQHAPNEHILMPVTEEALAIMAGLFLGFGARGQWTRGFRCMRQKGCGTVSSCGICRPGALQQAGLSGHHGSQAEGLFHAIANVGMAYESVAQNAYEFSSGRRQHRCHRGLFQNPHLARKERG